MLKMDRYHFFIIMCQHRAHYKACKMDFGPRFFLAIFRSTQPCQDPIDIFNVATMGLNKLWMPSSRHKCCFFMEKLFTIMVWSKDNNPQNDNPKCVWKFAQRSWVIVKTNISLFASNNNKTMTSILLI